MKQHLKLLQSVSNIDAILAVESIFQWAGEFNIDLSFGTLRTIQSTSVETIRHMYDACSPDPILIANHTGDKLVITATEQIRHANQVGHVLAAMGLKAISCANGQILFEPVDRAVDAEVLHGRLQNIDSVWILLRRLAHFEPDTVKASAAAITLFQFAQAWANLCVQTVNGRNALNEKVEKALVSQANDFHQWGVPGLTGVTLLYDPRGSTTVLLFEGHHPMLLASVKMDWAVGQPVQAVLAQANKKSTFGKFDVRPTRIPVDVQGVLNGLSVVDNEVKIVSRLAPKLYAKVNDVLNTIGGKWNTHRQAHVFTENPQSMIDELIANGEIFTFKDFEFFYTPPAVIPLVMAKAGIRPGMRGMEPNAGGGALAMAAAEIVGKDNMTCYELMPQNVKKLQALGFALEGPQDFLSVEAMPSFDFVIMNPPFSGGRDVAHIRHALGFVKAGGKLVAIASTQWRDHDTRPAQSFREYLASLNADIQDIAPGAFREAGTDVATTLITITKPIGVVKKVIHVPSVRQHLQEVLF